MRAQCTCAQLATRERCAHYLAPDGPLERPRQFPMSGLGFNVRFLWTGEVIGCGCSYHIRGKEALNYERNKGATPRGNV